MADAVETNAQVSKEIARAVLKLNGRIGGLEERVCAVRRYFLLATAPLVEAHVSCLHARAAPPRQCCLATRHIWASTPIQLILTATDLRRDPFQYVSAMQPGLFCFALMMKDQITQ